jgi:hypothetical protein
MDRMLGMAKTVQDAWMVGFEDAPRDKIWPVLDLNPLKSLLSFSGQKMEREHSDSEEAMEKSSGDPEKKPGGPDPKRIKRYVPLNRVCACFGITGAHVPKINILSFVLLHESMGPAECSWV